MAHMTASNGTQVSKFRTEGTGGLRALAAIADKFD
jgi:hypothetical protein